MFSILNTNIILSTVEILNFKIVHFISISDYKASAVKESKKL